MAKTKTETRKTSKANKALYVNKDIHKGLLCIKGTNIPLFVIVDYLTKGYTPDDILKRLPTLSKQKLNSVLKFTTDYFRSDFEYI